MEPQQERIVPTETEAEETEVSRESPPSNASLLVQEMVAAGEMPHPELIERIIAAGQEAIPPLIEVLATRPRGWPEEAPVQYAAQVLCTMGATEALPALGEVIRFYQDDTGIYIADEIFRIGDPGIKLLLELIGDSSLEPKHRLAIAESAESAAASDPNKRAQVAEVLRTWFTSLASEIEKEREPGPELQTSSDLVAEAAEEVESGVQVQDLDEDEHEIVEDGEDQDEDVDQENEESPSEWDDLDDTGAESTTTLADLAYHLAALGDELAHPRIQEAFEKRLVNTRATSRDDIESLYAQGGTEFPTNVESWLEDYRGLYDGEMERQKRLAELPDYTFPARSSYPSFDLTQSAAPPEKLPPIEPIRNVAPRIGRNDPCWCGSGKKYKKCHLGKDAPA
jgi:hypothetical protein